MGTEQILGSFPAGAKPKGCCRERGVKGISAGGPGRLGGVEALVPRCITGGNNRQKELCLPQMPAFEASLGQRGILQKILR